MEIWKSVPGYEVFYEVSNLGNVKRLKRILLDGRLLKERILKPTVGTHGYLVVTLRKLGVKKTHRAHQLVAMAFLGHEPCGYKLVINHKNFNKLDNRVENLEIVTMRENTNQKHLPSSSKYVGVCWHKASKKWISQIYINGKRKNLGLFGTELQASKAYKLKLKDIRNGL